MASKRKASVRETAQVMPPERGGNGAGIKKECLDSKDICRVTFRLPKEAAMEARQVTIVGDFNGWDETATPMKRQKNGDFTVTLDLKAGKDYAFRYLIDGTRWENDWKADRYAQNPHGTEDSIVTL